MRRLLTGLALVVLTATMWAQPKTSYYNDINGRKDAELKTALHNIIKGHTELTYGGLWEAFRTTDCRPDGTVWDMYSDSTHYEFGTNQDQGSHSTECDTYNREHSFPKSWFGGKVTPMYTDLFHLVPTDSYVNGKRDNYPLGDVKTPTYTSLKGFSKLGPCADKGYGGVVFEPADEYKGDFARIYFYMATRYEDVNGTWYQNPVASDLLDPTGYYEFYQPWYVNVLMDWHRKDPVSQKEIDRNNAVETFQHNRNPFVDYPVLAEFIWGKYKGAAVDCQSLELYASEYGGTGVASAEEKLVRVAAYDVSGRQVTMLKKGIYIVVYRNKEGKLLHVKEYRD